LRADLVVTALARVGVVAGDAAVPVHAGREPVAAPPPVGVVVLGQLDLVAGRALRGPVAEHALVRALGRAAAHLAAVVALPVRAVTGRGHAGADLDVAGGALGLARAGARGVAREAVIHAHAQRRTAVGQAALGL